MIADRFGFACSLGQKNRFSSFGFASGHFAIDLMRIHARPQVTQSSRDPWMDGCQLRAGAMRQAKRNEGGRGLRRRSGWSWVAKDQNRLRLKGECPRGRPVCRLVEPRRQAGSALDRVVVGVQARAAGAPQMHDKYWTSGNVRCVMKADQWAV